MTTVQWHQIKLVFCTHKKKPEKSFSIFTLMAELQEGIQHLNFLHQKTPKSTSQGELAALA